MEPSLNTDKSLQWAKTNLLVTVAHENPLKLIEKSYSKWVKKSLLCYVTEVWNKGQDHSNQNESFVMSIINP